MEDKWKLNAVDVSCTMLAFLGCGLDLTAEVALKQETARGGFAQGPGYPFSLYVVLCGCFVNRLFTTVGSVRGRKIVEVLKAIQAQDRRATSSASGPSAVAFLLVRASHRTATLGTYSVFKSFEG